MDRTSFQLELNLQRMSMVSLAIDLWDTPHIKRKIKDFMSQERTKFKPRYTQIYALSREIVEHLNSVKLPPSVLLKTQKIVVFVGEKIYDWIYHVTKIFKLDFVFTEKIYWTPYGTIDEVKIFDLHWKEIMSAPDFKYDSSFFHHSPIFSLACMYGQETFIDEHRSEIIDELAEFYPQIRNLPNDGDEVYNIMSISILLTENKYLRNINSVSRPVDMFKFCLDASFSKAASYYWKRLDEIEKKSSITCAENCLKGNNVYFLFVEEKCCEIFFFLVNQMEEVDKVAFLSTNVVKIVVKFLHVWPYQELIKALFERDWTVESSKLLQLSYFIAESKKNFNKSDCPLENELYFQIFQITWEKMSDDLKKEFVRLTGMDLCSNFDVQIFNLVFNDPYIQDLDETEGMVENVCKKLVEPGKFYLINELMEKVLQSNYVMKLLKRDYPQIVADLMGKNKFSTVCEFTDWLTDSNEEKAILKNKIDSIKICLDVTVRLNDFELADTFLTWRYETEEEIKNVKESIKSPDFILSSGGDFILINSGDFRQLEVGDYIAKRVEAFNYSSVWNFIGMRSDGDVRGIKSGDLVGMKSNNIRFRDSESFGISVQSVTFLGMKSGDLIMHNVCKIWNEKSKTDTSKNLKTVVEVSTAFIKFYYETDEEVVQFKKNRLNIIEGDKDFVSYVFITIFKDHVNIRFEILNEFLKFCLIPCDEIEEVKTKYRDDIEKWLHMFVIDQWNLELAEFFINWVYGTVEKKIKRETLKKFLNSSNKGALLCNAYLNGTEEREYFKSCSLLKVSNWLFMVDDVEKLKNDLREVNENVPEWFIALLDKLAVDKDVFSAVNAVRRQYFGVGAGGVR